MRTACIVRFSSTLLSVPTEGQASPSVGFEKVSQNDLGPTYQSWHPTSLRSGGTSLVTFDVPDRRGRWGSLEQVLPEPGSPYQSTALELFAPDVIVLPSEGLCAFDGGFGRLSDLRAASYRWRREGGSAPSFLATAFRLVVHDPDAGTVGSTWELVFEPVYNGFPVATGIPTGLWFESDVLAGFVWRSPIYLDGALAEPGWCGAHPSECYRYDRTPLDWGFGPRTVVVGVQLAAGSGWTGTYRGFADDVRLRFGGPEGRTYRWNFEPM